MLSSEVQPAHTVARNFIVNSKRRGAAPIGRKARGLTLIEIMVVVVILGILAAIVAPNVIGQLDRAAVAKAKQDIRAYETALNLYRLDNFKYPTTDQGLQALVTQPNDPTVRNWRPGGYISGLRKDPWGNDYVYVHPGQRGGEYDLYSLGADGQEGGEGPNADIGNWNIDQ
ncbi:MAG: type II secretion system protein GspG [Proteobacteria bacterium]|nr:MAG: type II secretion system protein GspG [Pseudomonadota bacterium]